MEGWLEFMQTNQLSQIERKFGGTSDEKELISLAPCGGDGGEGIDGLHTVFRQERMTSEELKRNRQYEGGEFRPLREWLAAAYYGLEEDRTGVEQLLLTAGAHEAINLLLRWKLHAGGVVLVETPASPEVLENIRQHGGDAVQVACDREGMLPESLAEQMALHKTLHRPLLLYVAPHYSNPSGRLWSEQRKRELLRICAFHQVPIIEDDTAGPIPFFASQGGELRRERAGTETGRATALFNLQRELTGHGDLVIGIGSFQATAFPSLPVAWIRGSQDVIHALKQLSPASAPRAKALVIEKVKCQQRLYALLNQPSFSWAAHAVLLEAEYAARRAAVLEQLREQAAWRGASFEEPQGGLFLWLRLPPGLCSEALLRAALLRGAAFMPGARCYAGEPDAEAIRLTFAAHSAARLRRGMARIAAAIAEFTARGAG
ncbi:aminotransferase class I/II-fold pyridoxal phosphate-dependent enzyme [Paenibacillus fonticola]|uniref:aminotransferase class I/II-fold pyridoxal phosphate-dependent enzyme n=1 Tax=Paenibacillus fonticola TaxID=379896 RepID=UPI00037B3B55|nr:PLP-dependent aminotransferase family protein [Paenibacillus fonticola]